MSELMRQFDSVCTTNGDDTAFYTSQYNSNSLKNDNRKLYSVGFSELNSNINLIASELHNRHSIRPAFTSSNRPTPSCIPTEEFMKEAGSRCILIISDQPSPGEAAAVMACTRLHITFVPLALGGPHRTNDSRVKVILQETQPIAAVVVLSLPDDLSERHEDDWEMRPALSSNEFDVDSHPAVIRLNHLGVHRIITVKGQDGSVIGSMAGLADGDLDLQTEEKIEEDGRDPMYILYTSGSTSKPKAVMQTYAGLWNRIRWQWRTFPFVQQMRRNIGLKETMNLLRKDGILPDDDLEKMHEINDIILRRTSLSFVDSMAEIFGTLLGGASLFCPLYIEETHETKRQGLGLVGMLDMASRSGIRITRMTCLPSQLSQAFCHHNKKKAITRSTKNPDWTETLDLVVVSGEPCPRSLPLLFNQIIEKEKGLLVNLYGQTETSGDVSCLVASSGNSGKLLLRFPDAKKYIWKSFRDISERGDFINKCSQTLIPCGLPIDGHKFTINPVVSEHGSARKDYGCLFVSGPGIAVGYFNNRPEMLANFMKLEDGGGNDDGYAKDRILFNTMDIAFEDGNGFIFVIGRAAKDAEDAVGTDGTGCSLTMGKVNGVLIHAAEIEDIFSSSLKAILFQHGLFREISRPNVIALLYNDTETGENKSAVFVDLTSFPYNSITFKMNVVDEYVIESSNVGFEASEMSFHDVVIETRSTILRNNHPSMVPHFIHLMSSVPTNGAAGKINRSYLANMLAKKLTENKNKTGL
jgi:acyl-CoA synthetase (AMP-forming)/AMP-acid ligase II